jgi:hypothetical protein
VGWMEGQGRQDCHRGIDEVSETVILMRRARAAEPEDSRLMVL